MKGYIIVAVLVCGIQVHLYASKNNPEIQEAKNRINQKIMPVLQDCQELLHVPLALDSQTIIEALAAYCIKNDNRQVAMLKLQSIKKALEAYKASESKKLDYYTYFFSSTPVIKEILQEIICIDKHLADLKAHSFSNFKKIGISSLIAASIISSGIYLLYAPHENVPQELNYSTSHQIADKFRKSNPEINSQLKEEAEKITDRDVACAFSKKDVEHARVALVVWGVYRRLDAENVIQAVKLAGFDQNYLKKLISIQCNFYISDYIKLWIYKARKLLHSEFFCILKIYFF